MNRRYELMLRWGGPCALATIGLGAIVLPGALRRDPAALESDGSVGGLTSVLDRTATDAMVRFAFEDVTDRAGLGGFRHFPAVRTSLLPEDMGSGVAWGDADGDGDLDLFVVNFRGALEADDAGSSGSGDPAGRCALFVNRGDGTFDERGAEAGLDLAIDGMAAAWGDCDDDGDLDLAVTAFGPNRLMINRGDGTFADGSDRAGVGDAGFGAGCAWGDYDGDGRIDLYVCNYVDFAFRPADRERATRQYGSEIPYTLNPSSFPPQSNRLYRNRGDGTFEDVADAAGVANPTGRSLGAVWFDFDGDGALDLYVANDVSANGVFRNMGDGTFADIGASSLAADYRGAMGLGVGDYDRDGDLDLFVTHWIAQENALLENMTSEGWKDADGNLRLFFMDQAEVLGLGQISLRTVGWATGFADFDADGLLDLFVVNGSTLEETDDNRRLKPQETHLFRQVAGDGYFEIGARAAPALATPFVGRGGAYGDFDGDGRIDLALQALGGGVILLRNTTAEPGRSLTLRLRQPDRNRFALGAVVTVRAGDLVQHGQVGADGSYLSQHQLDLHFGLGDHEGPVEVEVRWPDGTVKIRRDVVGPRLDWMRGAE